MSRSLLHRIARRNRGRGPYVWGAEPVISPYIDRLRDAAVGDHVCYPFVVAVTP